jgi:hypothetical protein
MRIKYRHIYKSTRMCRNDYDKSPILKSRCYTGWFPQRRPGCKPRSGLVGFVVGKVALGQVFSEYFGFPCQFLFHRLLHIHRHLSSGAGTMGEFVTDVPSGLSLTPPQETKKKKEL